MFHLAAPAVVRCVQFVAPPGNASLFPTSGRIEYAASSSGASAGGGGQDWRLAQDIGHVGQEDEPVKVLSEYVDVDSLSRSSGLSSRDIASGNPPRFHHPLFTYAVTM